VSVNVPDRTDIDVVDSARNKRGLIGRRIALSLLAVVVAVGATGFLGVHAGTARATSNGYHLTVTYPHVARSGLDIPWNLRLTHPGGFDDDIVVAISADYYDIFEFQGMHPEPSDETSDGEFVYLTFAPPKTGDVFTTALDTYVQPAAQIGRKAVTEIYIDDQMVARVSYKTWLVP
jgi:hypothetical protein